MTSPCSTELLESALVGELPPEREELLHRHLDECEACGAALAEMAGGAAWRQEAAAMLKGDELDDALPGYSRADGDEWSNADFTVEHLEPSDEPGLLGRLGGYDVLEIIGRGGMGVVLKGFDRELKRCVAIKVLSPHLAQSSLAKKRFAREAQAAAAVVHPNVLAIHQVQPGGRLPFLVMPLVAGESLAQRLTAQGRLELNEVLRIGMQAAAGLAAAHEQGLVHRDVKPANILLEKGVERAVLTDFGLARAADDVSMTRWGVIAGTPEYMSPEQAKGEPLDGRSDLFSLGCVLYEMATGVSPFRADSTMATLRRLIDDPPPAMASRNPELPPWFVGIVERLLEKDPSRRFASAKEVSELLEGCLAHLQQPAGVPLPAGLPLTLALTSPKRKRGILARASGWCNRRTLFVGTLAMLTALGFVLAGMLAMQATEPPDIAGQWSGEGWGQVVLTETAPGQYTGTYTDTVGKGPGKIELKWSRIERRFNGAWSEGEDRFGDLSIRLADQEIRGALTTDAKSKINPATPRLADLSWTRAEAAIVQHGKGMGPSGEAQRQYLAEQLRDAESGNFWAKYHLWAAYHKGTNGVEKNPEEARKWLAELVRGAYLATFRSVKGFAPKTPGEFLANFSEHSTLRSESTGLGGASFFRTTVKDGALVGSFLTAQPDKMRQAIADNPSLELISLQELTPEMFIRHEASPQESLRAQESDQPVRRPARQPETAHTVAEKPAQETKAVEAETPAGGEAKAPPVFGPVIERTLGPDGKHNIFLDLETGKLHDPPDPKEVDGLNVAQLRAWAAKNGVDLLAKDPLLGFDLAVFPMPDNRMWDDLPPADVLKVMEQATGATPAVITAGKELPVTVWFKTRKGALGVLQFLGYTHQPSGPHGVKIRYKLLQTRIGSTGEARAGGPAFDVRYFDANDAGRFVDLMSQGQFEKATEYFDDQMKKTVPPAELKKIWDQLAVVGGKFLGRGQLRTEECHMGYIDHTVYVPGNWERNKIDFKVMFNNHGKIGALWTVPPATLPAALPNGGSVELLGITNYPPTKESRWWKPDGSAADDIGPSLPAPAKWSFPKKGKPLAFLYRITGLPADTSSPVWRIEPSTGSWGAVGILDLHGETVRDCHLFCAELDNSAEKAKLGVGIDMGPWDTLITQNADSLGASTYHREGRDWTVKFLKAEPASRHGVNCTRVALVSDEPYGSWRMRLVAVTRDGGERASWIGSIAHNGEAFFEGLPLSSINEFRLQARPYAWVEFRNVSLHPGQRTDVQVVVPDAPAAAVESAIPEMEKGRSPQPTVAAMRALAERIVNGDQAAFDVLRDTAAELYRDIDYRKEEGRVSSNLVLMRAAFNLLGEQAGKGNQKAFEALKRSLGTLHLRSFAPDALGIAAAAGHAESLEMLLHHDKWGILLSSAVFALQKPAEQNNEKAVDFLVGVLENPEHRALWNGVSQHLVAAAASGNQRAKAALEKFDHPDKSQPKTTEAMPRRLHHFAARTTGNSARIACSADGRLIAIANGNPTIIHQTSTKSIVSDNWKPSADILDAQTGKTVVSLKLTTAEEDAVLAATERVSHVEATALAFSPDGNLLAVGTSIGQVKLFNARTGELVRSLDDEKAKLADKETPEKWKSLKRAMGSVASLAFSPDGRLLAVCGGSFADFSEGFAQVTRAGLRPTGPGRLKLWDIKTGRLEYDLVGHDDQANAVCFSPDGNLLASAGRWMDPLDLLGNGVILWNAHTGQWIHRLRTTASGGARSI
ncbi:MAG: protein kinase, partial [Thermoguttaceae bacterium]